MIHVPKLDITILIKCLRTRYKYSITLLCILLDLSSSLVFSLPTPTSPPSFSVGNTHKLLLETALLCGFYISSMLLLYVALISLDDIYAGLPRLALLFHLLLCGAAVFPPPTPPQHVHRTFVNPPTNTPAAHDSMHMTRDTTVSHSKYISRSH